MAYSVSYKASIERDLRRIPKPTASRLLAKLEHVLSDNPSAGEPLKGEFRGLFKYRIGEYRAIYTKSPSGVLILRIAHRKDVYRFSISH